MMAHSSAHLFGLPSTGLRFLTVYAPWAQPDMAILFLIRLFSKPATAAWTFDASAPNSVPSPQSFLHQD